MSTAHVYALAVVLVVAGLAALLVWRWHAQKTSVVLEAQKVIMREELRGNG